MMASSVQNPWNSIYREDIAARLLRDRLQVGWASSLVVAGRSMEPLLLVGDTIWVEWVMPETLQPGDIILMWRDGSFLTHRLVCIDQAGWHTKGDNSPKMDPPIDATAIIGRVTAFERNNQRRELSYGAWRSLNRWIGRASRLEYSLARAVRRLPDPARRWVKRLRPLRRAEQGLAGLLLACFELV